MMIFTSRPFSIDDNGAGVYYLIDAQGETVASFTNHADGKNNAQLEKEDALSRAFIVKACNVHDELVDRLQSRYFTCPCSLNTCTKCKLDSFALTRAKIQ